MVSIAERIGSFLAGIARDLKYSTWFTRRRRQAYAGGLLAFEVATFLLIAAVQRNYIVTLDRPTTTDFASFYAAGALMTRVRRRWRTTGRRIMRPKNARPRTGRPGASYYYYYPPIFLLVCAALAAAPYLASFVIFESATLIGYVAIVRAISRERGWASLVPILAFPAVPWTIGAGPRTTF